ncbi:snare associated Golgi protein-domain-containing protein [Mycena vitilis]|nr:snare associated Golgi protein-domain-containing protein [Mycena vitilis]
MAAAPLSVCTRRAPSTADAPPSPMLYLVASRILDWSHITHPSHDVLPLSAAPSPPATDKPPPQRLAHAPMLFVMLLFPLSTALVLFALTTLPITVSWPRTLPDLAQLGRELHGYSQSGPAQTAHVVGVMAVTAVWKHAWSVPGSVVWNVLGGALFSPALATILLTALTTIGSACATLLAMPLGPLITRFFPRALDLTRHALEGDSDADVAPPGDVQKPRSSAWVRLSVLRLIGVVPWSGINIACGVCGVSIWDCMLGCFIGCLPWTAVTCQIGDILQTVASHPSPTPQTVSSVLTSPAIITKLVLLSFLSLAPILGREHLRALISHDRPVAPASTEEKRASRWSVSWVQDWRTKIRKSSRSRTREASQHQLDVLVDEKRAIEDRAS